MKLVCHELETSCLIIGGGPAGYGAARTAAREGCPAILVERHGFLGGMGTAAGLSCYLNHRAHQVDLSASVYREFVQMQETLNSHYYDALAQADFFDPEIVKHTMESALLNSPVTLLYHLLLSSVTREKDGGTASFVGKGAITRIRARFIIDATGDADACALAGAEMTHGRRMDGKTQPMSMVVQLGGFQPAVWKAAGHRLVGGRYATEGDSLSAEIARARAAGKWTVPRENIAMFWSLPTDPTRVVINGTRITGLNSCNPIETSQAEIEGRRQAREILSLFRTSVPGFEKAFLLQTGPQIGVRESRRITGRATLTESAVRARVIPESSVMLCAYPIDVHDPDGHGTQFESTRDGHAYGIPWECQLPVALENIAAAGRCISATHEAAGSFRVMPTCMGLGEAAGTAAALAYRKGRRLHEIAGSEIRARMDAARAANGAPKLERLFPFEKHSEAASAALFSVS